MPHIVTVASSVQERQIAESEDASEQQSRNRKVELMMERSMSLSQR
jgi:hypothetical protein